MSKCRVCKGTRNVAADGPDPIGVPKGHPSLVACPRCQRARHERYVAAMAAKAMRDGRRLVMDADRLLDPTRLLPRR